ncbi:uncharacterized protein N7483_013165 [Penicillium malachiteum]|uniref:uncharacterized protein n=1 Tax=Penicillium malachiteum TaxID=1324776 RepID=UPI002548BA64|nr:uncharacterized protein N7483_013165 [Penicillium malachiteum]KAJ5715984.1 hypothetical protein N7483_013165 [Penicillium malachiteum]
MRRMFQMPHPIRLSFFSMDLYLVQGADNIKDVFKNSWVSTSTFLHQFSLRNAFGMSEKALEIYDKDDSGGSHRPYPGSTVEARNRVDYRSYQTISAFLGGNGLKSFWRRYQVNMTKRLKEYQIGSQWEESPDFLTFFETTISAALMDALCGKYLLQRSPNFLVDLWQLDRELDVLFKGTPKFLAPKVYATRERLLDAIKDWQSFAREHFLPSFIDSSGDDPFWGSKFFRNRQDVFMEMDGMDYDAIASEDFGAIWASTRNSIVAAFWTVIEIFQDPSLIERVRDEVKPCENGDSETIFDIDKLLQSPLLHASTKEIQPEHTGLAHPHGKTLLMSSTPAHMDTEAWNTGVNNEHPLDSFWAERFIKVANDEQSGPKKCTRQTASTSADSKCSHDTSNSIFAIDDVEGSWIPYGGGPRMCPGRHFAKREIILTMAMMVTMFDCDVLKNVRSLKMDMRGFGFGTLNAVGKVPVRMRRRIVHDI